MSAMLDLVTAALALAGAFFVLAAAIGLARLPDVLTRMHAASKVGLVGSGLILLGAAFEAGEGAVLARVTAGLVFFALGAPVAAHLVARALMKDGDRPPRL